MQPDSTALIRHWTVSVYIVHRDRVALHYHRKTGFWLPAGGHIEEGELPDETAIREALEETGLAVVLDGPTNPGYPACPPGPLLSPRPLAQPIGVQLVPFAPGHEHLDLVYRGRLDPPADHYPALADGFRWLTTAEAEALGAPPDVVAWTRSLTATKGEHPHQNPERSAAE